MIIVKKKHEVKGKKGSLKGATAEKPKAKGKLAGLRGGEGPSSGYSSPTSDDEEEPNDEYKPLTIQVSELDGFSHAYSVTSNTEFFNVLRIPVMNKFS